MKILENELLLLGIIGSTKGIKGFLQLYTKDDINILKGNQVILNTGYNSVYTIEDIDINKIKFKEISNINEAKKLVNAKLYILKRDLKLFNYILKSELLNMNLFYKNKLIGNIKHIISTPLYDILTVIGNREYNIPIIKKFIYYNRKKRNIKLKVSEEQF